MRCRIILAILAALVLTSSSAVAQHHELGPVRFPTSCNPAVQAEFETGVAMLHSFWFNYAGKTFRSVLERDPSCSMAYWGVALDLMGNILSVPTTNAREASQLLEQARRVEVKTERERLWLDAARAYYRDYDTVPVTTRLERYTEAMRQLATRFPQDFEAQVYYALTLQASAPKADMTYANQLKSAAMLETLYAQQPQHPGITQYYGKLIELSAHADGARPELQRARAFLDRK